MPADVTYFAAFVVGLMGGVHCVAMCGGIVGALTFGLHGEVHGRPVQMLPYLLAYNGGRILSYAMAGGLMGGLGWLAADLAALHRAQLVLQAVAGAFMVALGLYLAGWWYGLTRLERAGGVLWQRVEPLGRRLLPVRSPLRALQLGLVWGWLPCGLVYSVLVWSIAAGSVTRGALLMLSFGAGTLPALLGMGLATGRLAAILARPLARRLAGALVVGLGVYLAVHALTGGMDAGSH
ncbi:MAG: sulfite exporter TauE/SafE family protein [Gammaproteobacteria bacterium]|nr:sulfite exporter TauE/SafE family protein [Gammaproteobacteria bacterium]NIR83962.1 sulfite exporter TauE/SafE family protein [Gammaproteobacteria bacterium]NIU05260.1 sulfite exporter TauE/SafE family protein [Gammaproteobacteria bacterium]NIV52074.1 sulfite exporter TauE/SafE family protein [Gammaproteobacteria bacterium]NIV74248.1 sulfite exporter TauE/SafE family protein [Gammaproteobacteria bacterium]